MKHTVIYGLPKGHTEMYCKSNVKNIDKASYFEIEIMLHYKKTPCILKSIVLQ